MVDPEWLRMWRAMGVKSVTLDSKGELAHVEFFPVSLLDRVDALPEGTPEERSERDTEAPAAPSNIPRALQNLLKNGSVS